MKEREKTGVPGFAGRAGGPADLCPSGSEPSGRSSLTHDNLFRLAKQIEHEQSYDGNLPEIIRQCAERISELEDEILSAKEEMRERAARACESRADLLLATPQEAIDYTTSRTVGAILKGRAYEIRSLPLEGVSADADRAGSPSDRSPEGSPPDGCSSLTQGGEP